MNLAYRQAHAGILALLIAGFASYSYAQRPQRGPQIPKIEAKRKTVEGTLENMRPGFLQVATPEGIWVVAVDRKAKVKVTGSAEPEYLRPGMFVRFEVELDARQRVPPDAKIQEITIFTPQAPTDLGIASAQGGFASESEEEKKEPASQGSKYSVGGKLTGVKNGKLTVAAGETIKADLAEDATVGVDITDYRVASKGDKVTAEGTYIQEGKLFSTEITIALQNPLQVLTKKGRAAKAKAEKAGSRLSGASTEEKSDEKDGPGRADEKADEDVK